MIKVISVTDLVALRPIFLCQSYLDISVTCFFIGLFLSLSNLWNKHMGYYRRLNSETTIPDNLPRIFISARFNTDHINFQHLSLAFIKKV
jgi:hypothetical protein